MFDDDQDSNRAIRSSLKPGDFPLGSARSRAAARLLLRDRNHAANRDADVRIVFDLSGGPSPGYVSRSIDSKGKITDLIFPAHAVEEQCYGVFAIAPGVNLAEALRQARSQQEAQAASRPAPIDVSQFLKVGSKPERQPTRAEVVHHYLGGNPKALVN